VVVKALLPGCKLKSMTYCAANTITKIVSCISTAMITYQATPTTGVSSPDLITSGSTFDLLSFTKDIVEIVSSCITALASLVGGWWFLKTREGQVAADMSHTATHRPIDEHTVLLRVGVTITNRGKVLLRLVSGYVWLQQILPVSMEVRERIEQDPENPMDQDQTEIDWPLIGERKLPVQSDNKKYRELEPGEAETRYFDFVLSSAIETVAIYSYFKNVTRKEREFGWEHTSLYDLTAVDADQMGVTST
jgi:hypothetical protein